MNQVIIPNHPEMTRICPDQLPEDSRALWASMDALGQCLGPVAPAGSCLSLLDLRLLSASCVGAERNDLLASMLSDAERQMLAGFTSPKRKIEWLGGRLVAKHALIRLLAEQAVFNLRDYSLLPDAHGRPRLQPSPRIPTVPAVSISHSRDYAAALVTTGLPCGLDIQQKTPKLLAVQERVATVVELALLAGISDQLTRLALLWTAKEAVKKGCLADHPSFFGAIRLVAIQQKPDDMTWTGLCQVTRESGHTVRVRIIEFGDYLVACVAGEDHA